MESKIEKNNKNPYLDTVDKCWNSEDYPCIDQMGRFDEFLVQFETTQWSNASLFHAKWR